MRIAIVQCMDGHIDCCSEGQQESGHDDALSQVLTWCLEAGHIPAQCFWLHVDLPPVPKPGEMIAKAEAGEFPKSFIVDMDAA